MIPFPVKSVKLTGSSDKEVIKKAQDYFKLIGRKSKRQPYVRSAYFDKQKIFFTYFWKHFYQKPPAERRRRLQLLPCAIELIQKSRNEPESITNTSKITELFHRFTGVTKNKEIFFVQIKENRRTDRKEFMSVFPKK